MNLQEQLFKLHLYSPLIGQRSFQISQKESISDLRNTICETTELLMYQNFHFQSSGKLLGEFQELGEILTNEAKVSIVFDPFDERTSKFHFQKIKAILQNPSILAAHVSLSEEGLLSKQKDSTTNRLVQSLPVFLQTLRQGKLITEKKTERESNFSDYLILSGYNPIPYFRRLMGDYYYLHFKAPEEDFHITACSAGFFLNQSTNNHFNPNISTRLSKNFTSLLDLLYSSSPKFKQQFKRSLKQAKMKDPQRLNVNLLLGKKSQWLREPPKSLSFCAGGRAYLQKGKKEEFLSIKDWNEMFQFQHLQPVQGYLDRINREKVKFKIYQEFVEHAKIGVVQIGQRLVEPLNPHCAREQQSFLFANIYFSWVENSFETTDLISLSRDSFDLSSFKQRLASKKTKQTNNFINNLEILDNLQGLDLNLSHSVLLQYRGQRFRASSFPSSFIHSKSRKESMEDFLTRKNLVNGKGKNTLSNPKYQQFQKSLMGLTEKLNIEYDNLVRDLDTLHLRKITINDSLRGIQTPDRRKYIFNLQSLSPKDPNFASNTSRYCVFRPELISLYNDKFKCKVPINTLLGHSLPGYQHYFTGKIHEQQKKLTLVGAYANQSVTKLILHLLDSEYKSNLADTNTIIEVLHRYGLNCRYLGSLYSKAEEHKIPQIKIMVEKVIYVKCLKNVINGAIRNAPANLCYKIVARILNCVFFPQLLSVSSHLKEQDEIGLQLPKKKKKKFKQKEKDNTFLTITNEQNSAEFFLQLQPFQLLKIITKIAKLKYNHELQPKTSLNQHKMFQPKIFSLEFGKWAFLRDLCLNVGITLEKRPYFQASQDAPSLFKSEDFLSFSPRATHASPDKKEVNRLIGEGDKFLSHFQIEEAIQCYNKAIQYILTTYGGHNQKLPLVHKKLSFIYFKIGDIETALLFGTHALQMFLEFYGVEHIETLDNMALLGYYLCADRKFRHAEQYLFKTIYYSTLTYSEAYPQLLGLWLNLSTVYEVQKKFPQAILALAQGLRLCRKVYGEKHLNTAIYYTAMASLHFEMPDIFQAIKFKEKAVKILKEILPVTDSRVKESLQMLEYYRALQNTKKIKEIHEKEQKKMNSQFNQYSQMMAMNNKNMRGFGKMQEYFMRDNQEFWKRGSRKGRTFL